MTRPGRPRKPGPRYPSGELKREPLPGTTWRHAHRVALVGAEKAKDPHAGYPLGILYLRDLLSAVQHAAGLRYADLHHLVFGRGSPASSLGAIVAGGTGAPAARDEPQRVRRLIAAADDPARLNRLREAEAELHRASSILLRLGSRRPYDVLQNIAVYERPMRFMDTSRARSSAAWTADQRDLEALRAAIDVLLRHWGLGAYAAAHAAE